MKPLNARFVIWFLQIFQTLKSTSQKHEAKENIKSAYLTPIKQNRDNIDAFDENHYSFKELFPEL